MKNRRIVNLHKTCFISTFLDIQESCLLLEIYFKTELDSLRWRHSHDYSKLRSFMFIFLFETMEREVAKLRKHITYFVRAIVEGGGAANVPFPLYRIAAPGLDMPIL